MIPACPTLLASAAGGTSWLETVQRGGPIGYLIIALSIGAMALIAVHFVQIRRRALVPPEQVESLDAMLAAGDVAGAIDFCTDPENDSYLVRIMAAGLARYQQSAFGAFEFKNAIEEATDEQTARLDRSTDALGVIGSIAPLLGLLGTVLGMIGAFETLSRSAGANHEEMAASIGLALVTTLMGLTLAIPCIALFTFFRNRIDAHAADAASEVERLTLHLESVGAAAAPARPAVAAPARTAG